MKVYRVTSVSVVRSDSKLIIQSNGLTATPGWTHSSLITDDPAPADRVLEFALDATPPGGISIQVLTPVSASVVVDASDVDGVIVKSRTNSIEVHASEFQTVGSPLTTLVFGEEGPHPSTLAVGEEGPLPSTQMLGEEGPPLTTLRLGEEGSTIFYGESNPTNRIGEGPLGTDIRLDDPAITQLGGGLTTLALGEEGGSTDPRTFGQGTPFGGF